MKKRDTNDRATSLWKSDVKSGAPEG